MSKKYIEPVRNRFSCGFRNILRIHFCLFNPLVIFPFRRKRNNIYARSRNFEGTIEKDFFGNPLAPLAPVNRKPITATDDELAHNNRARSAKLRIAEKRDNNETTHQTI